MENPIKNVLKNLAANKKSILKRIRNSGAMLMGIIVGSVFVYSCGGGGGGGNSANGSSEARIAALEARIAELSAITDDGTTLTITGRNVQIVNGVDQSTINGLGNLIVGYDAVNTGIFFYCSNGFYTDQTTCKGAGEIWAKSHKTGSHNLVVGSENNYSQTGGVVFGSGNTSNSTYAAVTGGYGNTASSNNASVSGGSLNTANGLRASVSGGIGNTASGKKSSVTGGFGNTASGNEATASGGYFNIASGYRSTVTGGQNCDTGANNYKWVVGAVAAATGCSGVSN